MTIQALGGPTPTQWGIALAVYPGNSRFATVVERAPEDPGAGGPDEAAREVVRVLPPGEQIFVDELPADDAIWHYRAFHRLDGYTDGPATAWVALKVDRIPPTLPLIPPTPPAAFDLFVDPATHEVFLFVDGSPEVQSVRWDLDTTGTFPAKGDGTAVDTDDDGNADIATGEFYPEGGTIRATVTFYSGTSGDGRVLAVRRRAYSGTPRVPTVSVETTEDETGATLTLLIEDPDGFVSATAFKDKVGGATMDTTTDPTTWAVFDSSDPYTDSHSAALHPKHNTRIGWAVRWYDVASGTEKWIRGSETFDLDKNPDIDSLTAWADSDGNVFFRYRADTDSAAIRWSLSTTSQPSESTTKSSGTVVAGTSGQVNTGTTLQDGEVAYITVVPFPDASATDTDNAGDPSEAVVPYGGSGELPRNYVEFTHSWIPNDGQFTGGEWALDLDLNVGTETATVQVVIDNVTDTVTESSYTFSVPSTSFKHRVQNSAQTADLSLPAGKTYKVTLTPTDGSANDGAQADKTIGDPIISGNGMAFSDGTNDFTGSKAKIGGNFALEYDGNLPKLVDHLGTGSTSVSGSTALDYDDGAVQEISLTADTTITGISNMDGASMNIRAVTNGFTLTFGGSFEGISGKVAYQGGTVVVSVARWPSGALTVMGGENVS